MTSATFYPSGTSSPFVIHDYEGALEAIRRGEVLHTTQMCLMNEAKDYDLICVINGDDKFEIRNNHDGTYECDRTEKEIRYAHNLFKMWEGGVFDR